MSANLDKEFNFYLAHQEDLVKKHNGKYLVIKGQKVIGVYDTTQEAYFETQKEHELGTFLIQLCTPGEEAYTETFHSRAWL